MSTDQNPKPLEESGFDLIAGTQAATPIAPSNPLSGRGKYYAAVLIPGLIGLAVYWVSNQYILYSESESIEALKAAGLLVVDMGDSISVSDPNGHLVNDDCLAHIGRLKRPVKASFNNSKLITDAGLRCLSGNNRICVLHLSRTGVTDEGIKHLCDCECLESLDLSQTAVSDTGLLHLASSRLPNLQDLNIRKTAVSDTGMKHLEELRGLRFLVVEGTKITADGAYQLKSVNPDVLVFGLK